jgi:D-serine deaminase-like pyridoxal phosphate-dependent protein
LRSSAPAGSPGPRRGEVVAIVPSHVCPVVEQFDDFVVAREGRLEDRWPVDARGRSR